MKGSHSIRELTRTTALIGLAAFSLHQLRYLIGYGSDSSQKLSQQGHGYMADLLPELLGAVVVVVAATLIASALSSRRRGRIGRESSRWIICSSALLAIYAVQETVEGVLSSGHPSGVTALTGGRGWVALPLALALGAVVTLMLRALRETDRVVAGKLVRACELPRATGRPVAPASVLLVPAASRTLAFGFACRPPPLHS